jgi:hypothetical protein
MMSASDDHVSVCTKDGKVMDTAREEIRIGQLAIRFLLEGHASGGSIAVFEFHSPNPVGRPL